MLWCKATFAQHFDSGKCRLFPTQRQLFEFVDAENSNADGSEIEGTRRWLPFSVEFPSEEEAVRLLASRSVRSTPPVSGSCARQLFRKRPHAGGGAIESPDVKRHACTLREDYSLLYGETPLSAQSRMFLAATAEGIIQVVRDIEPLQRHLYEVIREDTACHMYLDVERDRDFSAWRQAMHVSDSESSSDTDSGNCLDHCLQGAYECESSEYTSALKTALWRPARCCPWNCGVRADNNATTTLLLRELHSFLQKEYPGLLSAAEEDNLRREAAHTGRNDTVGGVWPLGPGVDVMVMRSVYPCQGGSEGGAKFSQHYVVKFGEQWFRSNGDVGCVVSQFIDYLYERVGGDPEVHAALFYHDTPKEFPVLPHGTPQSLPFLPLKCIIDPAVYSRNRTMRCLGSCKLHKASILTVETTTERRRDAVSLFFASLITLPRGFRKIITLPDGTRPSGSGGKSFFYSEAGKVMSEPLPVEEMEGYNDLAKYLGEQWSSVGGVECCVSSIRRCGGRYVLFLLKGSRYCGNVCRQHRSNNVYISVDLERGEWVQKCFDPECSGFRTHPQPLPALATKCVRTVPTASEWVGGSMNSSLALHASLRTPFRPSQEARDGK